MADRSALTNAFTKVRTHGLRYSLVSIVNVAIGQLLIFGFLNIAGIQPALTNVLAVSLSAVPAYYLSRAWVWGKRGKSHLTKEVLPFWGFAVAGLVLSTVSVALASEAFDVAAGVQGWRRIVPNLANLSAFGVLWVVKFFVLDALVFGNTDEADDEADEPDADEPDELDATGSGVTERSPR